VDEHPGHDTRALIRDLRLHRVDPTLACLSLRYDKGNICCPGLAIAHLPLRAPADLEWFLQRVFSRSELVSRVFGMDYEGLDRTIDVHMMNLRKKIETHPDQPLYLQTVYGVGYKLRREEHESA
jgi:DNA-binding response OmpR family regulator